MIYESLPIFGAYASSSGQICPPEGIRENKQSPSIPIGQQGQCDRHEIGIQTCYQLLDW